MRHGDYRGGDKIYLINPSDPMQAVDVVLADKLGRQMTDPIWSPDGNTLIVFTVQYDASQPYQLDITGHTCAARAWNPDRRAYGARMVAR